MPPVFGPSSPSYARLWSWLGRNARSSRPSTTAIPVTASATLGVIVVLSIFGAKRWRLWSPLIGLLGGVAVAAGFGLVDADPILAARWVGLPALAWPGFDLSFGPAFWALLPAFLIPPLNSTAPPYFDLTGWIGVEAYYIANSGSTRGIPWIAIALLLLLISRSGFAWKPRLKEALVILVALVVLLGGGAALNEFGVKRLANVFRPDILLLAETPSQTEPGRTVLGETAAAFYDRDRDDRTAHLEAISNPDAECFAEVPVHKLVCKHWIETTGFSFPSGHSLTAMFFATFFLALALYFLSGWRRWPFYLLVPWAVLVCFSRTILRVHSPTDITVGGLEGVIFGAAAFLLVRTVLKRVGAQ